MKTQNPFTGRSSGSLANVTASTYLGHNILKSKPLEVRNPRSPKQINVRNVLKSVATLAKSLSAIVGIAKRSARTGRSMQKTARTALVQAILSVKSGVAPDIMLNRNGISLQGSGISATQGIQGSFNSASKVLQLTWPEIIPVGGSASDKVSVCVFDLTSGRAESFNTSKVRDDNSVSVTVTDNVIATASNVAVFLMFDSADGTAFDAVISERITVL